MIQKIEIVWWNYHCKNGKNKSQIHCSGVHIRIEIKIIQKRLVWFWLDCILFKMDLIGIAIPKLSLAFLKKIYNNENQGNCSIILSNSEKKKYLVTIMIFFATKNVANFIWSEYLSIQNPGLQNDVPNS